MNRGVHGCGVVGVEGHGLSDSWSGVSRLMPRGPLWGECHGCIPFANDFLHSVQKLGELLQFGRSSDPRESGVEAQRVSDFFSGHVRHLLTSLIS